MLWAIGAQAHQAVVVAHDDETHPHAHILLNRVHPETGEMLSSSKVKLRLSQWAQGYEDERGYILCEQRVINNAARARGEFKRASGERDRGSIDGGGVANDNRTPDRKKRLAELCGRGRDMEQRHAQSLAELERAHKAREGEVKTNARRGLTPIRAKLFASSRRISPAGACAFWVSLQAVRKWYSTG